MTVDAAGARSGLAAALPLIDQLIATGKIPRAVGHRCSKAEVIAAQVLIGRGNTPAAIQVLRPRWPRSTCWSACGVVKAADVAPLRKVLVDAIASLGG